MVRSSLLALVITLTAGGAVLAQTPERSRIEVEATRDDAPSGRLLLFAQPVDPARPEAPSAVTADPFFNRTNFVAAREVTGLTTGARRGLDGDDLAHPSSIDALPPGDYWMQAVLDRDHDYAYYGRADAGDVTSAVTKVTLPTGGQAPVLPLTTVVPDYPLWETARGPMFSAADKASVEARIKPFEFVSPALSAFHGRPISMRGVVLTPEGYDEGSDRYPVVYMTHGFSANQRSMADQAVPLLVGMHNKRLPPMIWVLLDQSGPFGTHEFADSVNTGPWATALTQELIPDLERRHRVDGRADSRFLMGHSSGGWAMLWLQVNYPTMFGGAWITAPDYTDFTDIGGVDINAPGARMDTEMARIEAVLGDYGGQAVSLEAVFSPRGPDGRPMPLYDRATGAVDPQVAKYWSDHWDVARIIRARWPAVGHDLNGKLHVWAGEEDQFALDDSVRRLEAAITGVGGRGDFHYLPGKGHFDLYDAPGERQALRRIMAWQMWRQARPESPLTDPGPPPAPAAAQVR